MRATIALTYLLLGAPGAASSQARPDSFPGLPAVPTALGTDTSRLNPVGLYDFIVSGIYGDVEARVRIVGAPGRYDGTFAMDLPDVLPFRIAAVSIEGSKLVLFIEGENGRLYPATLLISGDSLHGTFTNPRGVQLPMRAKKLPSP